MEDVLLKPLTMKLEQHQLKAFFPLLQQGVTVPATVGCSLKSLLCDQLAIPADYVTDRITTVFLDNRPVDDLDHTLVRNGSRITLSAAMPGLVGATMRRGGYYAALRQGISHAADRVDGTGERGVVRIKLFNLLLSELGPLILARAIIMEQNELNGLLQNLPGAPQESSPGTGQVLLTVQFKE